MMNERIEIITGLAKHNIFPHPHNEVVYKYVDVDTAIKILTGGTLKFQAPNFFNDVFDPHLGLLDITKGRERIQNEIFKKYSPETIEKYLQTHSLEEIEQTADTVVMNWINKAGILCLSKNYKHTLMWSHYAAKHTGVCLGFTNIGYKKNDGTSAFRIHYATEVIPREYLITTSIEDKISMIYWVCTKAKVWEYEEEVRVINYRENGLFPFNKTDLCEIYFGVKTAQSDIDAITEIITAKGYELSKVGYMKISKQLFDLEVRYT